MGGLVTKNKNPPDSRYSAPTAAVAGPITVFFASATGKSEGFANALTKELISLGFNAVCSNLVDFKPEVMVSTKLAVFLMSTSGEGSCPFGARSFMTWVENKDILNRTSQNALNSMSYIVFGLGNREYRHYNKCGTDTDSYLEKLGANRLMEVGLGDDSGTLEDDYEVWRHKAINVLMVRCHPRAAALGFKEEVLTVEGSCRIPGRIQLTWRAVVLTPAEREAVPKRELSAINTNSSTLHFFTAPECLVTVNRELRESEGEGDTNKLSTRHIEIDLTNTGLKYDTADTLAVLPQNCPTAVDKVGRALNLRLDDVVQLQPRPMSIKASKKLSDSPLVNIVEPFPTPCTVGHILTHYMDISVSAFSVYFPICAFLRVSHWTGCLCRAPPRELCCCKCTHTCRTLVRRSGWSISWRGVAATNIISS